ncbi:MAG: VCBS repeat-containing protein, partial [Candidatus Aenigmarchaeota archaeon]|nr:VCBS repeat-containing protein [Candidatus Aenigmarchaeota archaeon]
MKKGISSRNAAMVTLVMLAVAMPILFATAQPTDPDLIIESIFTDPLVLVDSQPVLITATVSNIGGITITDPVDVFFSIDGNLYDIATDSSPLPPNSSVNLSFTWFAVAGQHTVAAEADPNQLVPEDNETNNVLVQNLPFVSGPDLVVTGVFASPERLRPGDPVTFTATLANRGITDITADFYLELDVDGTLLTYDYVADDIPANGSVNFTSPVAWTATSPGIHNITMAGDVFDYIAEQDESNNQHSNLFSVLGPPAIANITTNPAYPGLNQDVTVMANVTAEAGVASATLSYSLNGSAFINATMVENAGLYEATIPGQAATTNVAFIISAADLDGFSASAQKAFIMDGSPPTIAMGQVSPPVPNATTEVEVNADIRDNVGIGHAEVLYSLDNITFSSVPFNETGISLIPSDPGIGSGPTTLASSYLFWDTQSGGYINDGGSDAYDGMYFLNYQGSNYGESAVQWEASQREIVFRAQTIGGLVFSRKFYAPQSGYWGRYIDTVHNPAAGPVNITMSVHGNLGSDGSTTTWATESFWLGTDDTNGVGDPSLAHVFGKIGASGTNIIFTDNVDLTYNLIVQPGENRSVVTFAVKTPNQTHSRMIAEEIVALFDSESSEYNAFMTTGEAAIVANWKMATTAAVIPASNRTGDVFYFVNATDLSGNSAASATASYFTDGNLPNITNITFPLAATIDQNVTISAIAADDMGILAVFLNYSLGSGYQLAQMAPVGSGIYEATVDLSPAAGNMTFSVIALDTANNHGVSSQFTVVVFKPIIQVSPSSMSVSGVIGEFLARNLTIANDGDLNLTAIIQTPRFAGLQGQLTAASCQDEFIITGDGNGNLYYIRSNGDGTFGPQTFIGSNDLNVWGLGIADFDSDSDCDFVHGGNSNNIRLYRQISSGSFGPPAIVGTYTSSGYSMDIAAADYNNDGNADFVISGNNNLLFLFSGNGDGTFVRTSLQNSFDTARGKDAGDVDNDGNMDFVIATTSNNLYLYKGNGDGTFQPFTTITHPFSNVYSVMLGDFDGDGNTDILSDTGGSGGLYFLGGRGDGTFEPEIFVGANLNNYQPGDAFDFSGDGNLDIVMTDFSSRRVWYFPGNGDGTFQAGQLIGAAVGSGDRMGIAGPLASNAVRVVVQPHASATLEYVFDSTVPINKTDNITIRTNDGANPKIFIPVSLEVIDIVYPSLFNITQTPTAPTVDDIVTITAVATDDSGIASVLINYSVGGSYALAAMNLTQNSTYQIDIDMSAATGNLTYQITATDLGGNQNISEVFTTIVSAPAIAVSPASHDFGTLLIGDVARQNITIGNNGTSALKATITIPRWLKFTSPGTQAESLFLVAGDDSSGLYTISIFGNNTFGAINKSLVFGTLHRGVGNADFDLDGDQDFVTGNPSNNHMYFAENRGGMNFAAPRQAGTPISLSSYVMDIATGDFNNDKFPDFVVSGNNDDLHLFLGYGNGSFNATTITFNAPGSSGRGKDAADLNGDSYLDFVYGECCTGTVYAYLGNGMGGFAETFLFDTSGNSDDPYGIAAADFDGDGIADIIAQGGSDGEFRLYKGLGDGRAFADMGPVFDTDNPGGADNFDFDSDGDQDIAVMTGGTRDVRYYRNNGTGSFAFDRSLGLTTTTSFGIAAPEISDAMRVNVPAGQSLQIEVQADTSLALAENRTITIRSNDPLAHETAIPVSVDIHDTMPPAFTSIETIPQVLTVDYTAEIRAVVTDNSRIRNVTINFSVGGSPFSVRNMTLTSPGTYSLFTSLR